MAIVKVHYYNNDNHYLEHKLHIIIDDFQKILVTKGQTTSFTTSKGKHNLRIYYVFPNKYIDTKINIENDENFYIYSESSMRNNSTIYPGKFYEVDNEIEFEKIYKEKHIKLGIICIFIVLFWIFFLLL